jgi:hypothetical protein
LLWRLCALQITMRANAPITAILALAALFLSPSTLLARPKHAASHAASKTAPKQRHGRSPAPRHSAVKNVAARHTLHSTRVQDSTATGDRSKNSRDSKSSKSKSKAKSQPKAAAKPKRRRRHREVVDETVPATVTRIHSRDSGSSKATSSDFLRAASSTPEHSASAPVPVVSIVRPAAERPSLPSAMEVAAAPVLLPSLYNKRGRLIMPPALKGSHEILLRQNQVADRDGLDRIHDDDEIVALRSQRLLVALPVSNTLVVDERLPSNRRYCRPWTAQFLSTMARAYYMRFHTPLQVNSAVRTVEFQQRLLRTNGNAAPAEGDTASPHLTGQAVDLAKHGLSLSQIAWMRGYLLPLVQEGKVDVEEEFQQACFHISVYKKYLPPAPAPPRDIATAHRGETSSLAIAVH